MAGAKGPLARLFDEEGYPVGPPPVDFDDRPVVPAAEAARQKLLAAVADDGPGWVDPAVVDALPKGPWG